MFDKYDSYVDSGIEWLGDVPSKWNVKRNKYIFNEVVELSLTGKETLLTVSHITSVTPRSEKNVNMFFAETMEGYKLCKKGDLIINTMWAWMGALGTSQYNGICSPAYNVYRANRNIDYSFKYFDYLFRIPNFIIEMTKYSKGIVQSRLRLYPREFFQIKATLPPLKTQMKIVTYLDKKIQTIDKDINLLEQKTLKYKELKKTIINETISIGLDKTIMLKDSDVEWIISIPNHWKLKRMKDEVIPFNGGAFKDSLSDKGLPIIKIKQLVSNIQGIEFCDINSSKINKGNLLKAGDIVFSWSTLLYPFIYNGEDAVLNQHIFKLIYSKDIDKKYLYYSLLSGIDRLTVLAHGSTMKHILKSDFDNFEFFSPPLEEQIKISEYLDEKISKIDNITKSIQTKITLLKEFRKTLINDTVIGKIKVA